MNLVMSGLDYRRAPVALREGLSFTRTQGAELCARLREESGLLGCVLLSTCNRTELYCSCPPQVQVDPAALLCQAVGATDQDLEGAFVTRRGEEAARHLMEVAAGLQSQIWGDDQIVSQVKQAVADARERKTADPVLETLFREAAAAGKEVKSQVRLSRVPVSAASRAVELLSQAAGGLAGRRALVIGNGEMGRLAAGLLYEAGCHVTITLRSYHHGETLVPAGCSVVPYEERYRVMREMDLLLSATVSPHYTVAEEELGEGAVPPLMVDLAMPRDIEPAVGERPGVRLFNMDDLGAAVDRAVPAQAQAILERHLERVDQWSRYRESLDALEEVKRAITRRVLLTDDLSELDQEELVELAVGRAVDLLSGGLRESVSQARLRRCAALIRTHTRAGG